MSDFKAMMHQILFRLGLCPRPPGGFKGPTSKKWEGGRGKGKGNLPPLKFRSGYATVCLSDCTLDSSY